MDKTDRDCVVDTGGIDTTCLCAFIYTACTEFCSETGRLLCRKSYRDADRDRTDTPLLPAEPDCAGVEVLTAPTDTLLTLKSLSVNVQALPLLKKEVLVDAINLEGVKVNTGTLSKAWR